MYLREIQEGLGELTLFFDENAFVFPATMDIDREIEKIVRTCIMPSHAPIDDKTRIVDAIDMISKMIR